MVEDKMIGSEIIVVGDADLHQQPIKIFLAILLRVEIVIGHANKEPRLVIKIRKDLLQSRHGRLGEDLNEAASTIVQEIL